MSGPASVPFEPIRKLADGAAAEVLLARELKSGEQVVVKVLRSELTSDASVVGRFLDEAKVFQRMRHPNIVRCLGSGQLPDGRVYVMTELLEGRDLGSQLRRDGPLASDELLKLAIPLAEALEHVHQHGVIHRDLKPDNIFLAGGLQAFDPRLLDFGLARFEGPKSVRTATGVILSTPEYTPPECIQGQKADARSDLYSFGIVLFEALTGAPPFVAGNYGELLLKHLSQPPPALPASATHLQKIVHRCLCKEPENRYGSAAELGQALSEALSLATSRTFISRPGAEPGTSDGSSVGETFGSYEAVRLLGEGSMGQVYLARHKKLGRQVALKKMRPDHARNGELVKRFFQEARTVNEINHEHIVEIFDFVEDVDAKGEQRVFCVMELLSGASLTELARSEQLSLRRIVNISRQIASALGAAHRVGVVHRDIKPDNVFVTERSGISDFVKVLDFGVAKLVVPLSDAPKVGTMEGAIIGTPAYMAPEQASGAGTDFRADIYALGVVMYELLSGRLPFTGTLFGQLVVQIMTQAPPPLPSSTPSGEPIPPALAEVAMRCLAKKPEERPQSMAEVAGELSKLLPSLPEAARKAPAGEARARAPAVAPPEKPGPGSSVVLPPGARRRWPVLAAAGAVLLASSGGGVYALLDPPRPVPAQAQASLPPAPPPAPAPPPRVRLRASSNPPGARVVRADTGEVLGATPLSEQLPRAGAPVVLRFELAGHRAAERTVSLSGDVQISVDLSPEPPRRPVEKKSRPPRKKESSDAVIDPFAD